MTLDVSGQCAAEEITHLGGSMSDAFSLENDLWLSRPSTNGTCNSRWLVIPPG